MNPKMDLKRENPDNKSIHDHSAISPCFKFKDFKTILGKGMSTSKYEDLQNVVESFKEDNPGLPNIEDEEIQNIPKIVSS